MKKTRLPDYMTRPSAVVDYQVETARFLGSGNPVAKLLLENPEALERAVYDAADNEVPLPSWLMYQARTRVQAGDETARPALDALRVWEEVEGFLPAKEAARIKAEFRSAA